MTEKHSSCVREIAQTLFDKKGSNIIAIDVKGISSITDYVIIADGNVDRHVVALAKEVEDIMRDAGEKPAHVEGMQNGDWIVLDYFQVVIHLLVPEMREKYQLERLWPDGKVIDLSLQEKRIAE
ncbi:MAG: ribosome silencing factor [Simkaniaceae bacterium]|nr:MAG: ribosome silencing factor [Simkaniaceae bacterium]